MRISDWSSDVCSSDLLLLEPVKRALQIPELNIFQKSAFNIALNSGEYPRVFRNDRIHRCPNCFPILRSRVLGLPAHHADIHAALSGAGRQEALKCKTAGIEGDKAVGKDHLTQTEFAEHFVDRPSRRKITEVDRIAAIALDGNARMAVR